MFPIQPPALFKLAWRHLFSNFFRRKNLTLFDFEQLTGEGLAQVLPHFINLVAINLLGVVYTTSESVIGLANIATQLQDVNLRRYNTVTDDAVLALATSCLLRLESN